jgi:hypothetical protein
MRTAFGGWQTGAILGYGSGPSQTIFGLNGGATLGVGGVVACDANATPPRTLALGNCSPGAPGGIQGTGYATNQKPNRVLQDCRSHGGLKNQWYNPAAFTLDNYQLGSFGNSSVGSCTGPGLANTDFSVFKNFKLTERIGMQFRLEFFNLFNKVQFRADQNNFQLASQAVACTGNAALNTTAINGVQDCSTHALNTVSYDQARDGQGSFGQITKDRGPREIQYALKLTF